MGAGLGTSGVGLALLGVAAMSQGVVTPEVGYSAIAGGIIISCYGMVSDRKTKLDNLFINCGLCKKTQNGGVLLPKKLKRIEKEHGEDIILSLPAGMSLEDFENHRNAISQHFDMTANFQYNNGVIIMQLRDRVIDNPFVLKEYKEPLKIAIGYNLSGEIYAYDIEQGIHTLVAGATGSGKSVLLRVITTQLIKKNVQLHLVDFARVELGIFKKSSKVTFCQSVEQFGNLLTTLEVETDRRLDLFEQANVVNIQGYNRYKRDKLKYIVVIVDEFGELADKKELLEKLKIRVARDRKVGIHYILCTQRPSVDIISGSIKVNMPTRIALRLPTDTDSKVIIDVPGAEKLKRPGQALIKTGKLEEVMVMNLDENQARDLVKDTFVTKSITRITRGYL